MLNEETPRMGLTQHHVVVVLDDEPSVLHALTRMFRAESFEFRSTVWPAEVLDWVMRGEVSLVIVDQRMPDTTGIATIKQIQRRSPKTKCVILTGYPSEELQREADELGVRAVITKPWDDVQLKRNVRLLLRERELQSGTSQAG